jgi:hypothetical protein
MESEEGTAFEFLPRRSPVKKALFGPTPYGRSGACPFLRPVAVAIALATFTVDGKAFMIRMEAAHFILLAGSESGQELARVGAKTEFRGAAKLLSALGNFLGVSGIETAEQHH